jgi:hypothetical protein
MLILKKVMKKNKLLNIKNANLNSAYDKILATASATKGGDYVLQRGVTRNLTDVDTTNKNKLEDQFKNFYRTEKLQQWNSALGSSSPLWRF